MTLPLTPLPFAYDALAPHMSRETLEFHHDKHHKAYVDKANELLPGSGLEGLPLVDAMLKASQNPAQAVLFNQLGQDFNHTFFWHSLAPGGGGKALPPALSAKIESDLGGFDAFRAAFIQAGMTQFGSGWAWLVLDNASGKLAIMKTANADTPLVHGKTPLLTCDVWEHAYYIDHRNARAKFLETFVDHLANWAFAEANLAKGPVKIAA